MTVTVAPIVAPWWRAFGKADAVDVFHVDAAPDAHRIAAATAWLDADERRRLRRCAHEGARLRFALCRGALRAILCAELGCTNERLTFATARHGKPFALIGAQPAPVSFNLSHSGRHGLIAIAPSGRVGVDVEERDAQRNLDLLVDTVLGDAEQAALAAAQGGARVHLFFKMWTIKEALLKAMGKGFSLDATCIEVPSPMLRGKRSGTVQAPPVSPSTWHVEDLGNREFAAAVAYESVEANAPAWRN